MKDDRIELNCPACGVRLKLPSVAAGREARCPACQAVFPVRPAATGGRIGDVPTQPYVPAQSAAEPTSFPPQKEDPFAPPEVSGIENEASRGVSSNPYAPASAVWEPVKAVGDVVPTPVSIDEVANVGWRAFADNWLVLFLANLISSLASLPLVILNQVLMPVAEAAEVPEILPVLGAFTLTLVNMLISVWLTAGVLRMTIAAVRRQPVALCMVFSAFDAVPGLFGLSMLAFGSSFLAVLPFMLAVRVMGDAAPLFGFATILTVFVVSGLVTLRLWPVPLLVIDRRRGVLGSLTTAWAVTRSNRLTSFLMWLLTMGLAFLGYMLCCFGILLTLPLSYTIIASGFLLMCGEPVHVRTAARPRMIA